MISGTVQTGSRVKRYEAVAIPIAAASRPVVSRDAEPARWVFRGAVSSLDELSFRVTRCTNGALYTFTRTFTRTGDAMAAERTADAPRPTLVTVARHAGVSIASVSRVLNGLP